MVNIDWASGLDSGMMAGLDGNLLPFTGKKPTFDAKGFRLELRTSALPRAAAMLFAVATLLGCGAPSGGAFSGSPVGSGSGGIGSSTGTASSSTATSVTATAVNAVTVDSTSIAAKASISKASLMPESTVTLNAAAPAGWGGRQQPQTFVTRDSPAAPSAEVAIQDAVAAPSDPVLNLIRPDRTRRYGTATPISISISPSSTSLLAGATQLFTATVTGSANTAVSWTTTGGSITNTGLFTAPNVSASVIVTVSTISQADPSVVETAPVLVTPILTPPPPGGGTGTYSGTGPVASWKAYQYLDTDNRYHQAIEIYNAQGNYPVIGYSYSDPGCTDLGDTFNDYWQPIGNGLWWFINRPALIYVKWVWYDNSTNKQILQQTPCIDYSGAPKYN